MSDRIRPADFGVSDYLGRTFDCSCGRRHGTVLESVQSGTGIAARLPALFEARGWRRVFLVADENTYAAAFQGAGAPPFPGLEVTRHIFPADELIPDETALGAVFAACPTDCDGILAVGSGVINDLCRFAASRLGKPYAILATAPSMDGFASTVSPLIIGSLKTTYPAVSPVAILSDPAVLAAAPMPMIAAGFGDTLGKHTALADWAVAHIVNGEYLCPSIVGMVRESLRRCTQGADGYPRRDPEAVGNLMDALVLTGVAMSFSGNSRPASGAEHHISHYLEMQRLFAHERPDPHGVTVGIGTVISLKLYAMLAALSLDFGRAKRHGEAFDRAAWADDIRRCYGSAADGVLALERSAGKNAAEGHARRLAAIEQNWGALRDVAAALPAPEEAERLLSALGAPTRPAQLGIERGTIRDAIVYSKELRDRYVVTQLLWDLGLLEEYADRVVEDLYA